MIRLNSIRAQTPLETNGTECISCWTSSAKFASPREGDADGDFSE
jgi:hypothetical protein